MAGDTFEPRLSRACVLFHCVLSVIGLSGGCLFWSQWNQLPENALALVCSADGWSPSTSAVRLVCKQWQRAYEKAVPCLTPRSSLPGLVPLYNLTTRLKRLTHLDLRLCSKVTNRELWTYVAFFGRSIRTLQLPSSESVPVDTLRLLTSLTGLMMSASALTNHTMHALGAHTTLKILILDCGDSSSVTDEGMRAVGKLRHLEHLALTDFTHVTDKGMFELCTLTSLRELSINGCSLITDCSVLMIAIQMKRLDMLTLVRCQLLTNSAVVQLSSLSHLRRLNLQYLPRINHECLWALSALPLELLRLSGCCITDAGAAMLLHIPTLRELNIVGCGVTRRGLAILYRGLPATHIVMSDQDHQSQDE